MYTACTRWSVLSILYSVRLYIAPAVESLVHGVGVQVRHVRVYTVLVLLVVRD